MRIGKQMQQALDFATKHQGWHRFTPDRQTVEPIKRLVKLGFVEVNGFHQFRSRSVGPVYTASA